MSTFQIANVQVIPLAAGQNFFDQRVILAGIELVLSFSWNDRAGRWFLDVSDQTGAPILTSIKLAPPFPLLNRARDPRLPAGDLYVVGGIPALATLGQPGGASLLYAEWVEVSP